MSKIRRLRYDEMNLNNLEFGDDFNENDTGKNLQVRYYSTSMEKSYPIIIKTPPLIARFGIDKERDRKYTVNLALNKHLRDKTMRKFFEFCKDLDQTIFTNCKIRSGAEKFYSPFKNNGKYDPMLRVKLPLRYKKCDFKVFKDGKISTIFEIKKCSKIVALIQLQPCWFIDEKFGYYWNAKELHIIDEEK